MRRANPLPFRLVRVEGPSMVPLLASGQRLLVGRVPLVIRRFGRGDILIVHHPRRPGSLLVKRLVGVPGDRIAVRHGHLEVNDARVSPEVSDNGTGDTEWRLGPREYFVAGTAGEDSRSFGPVSRDAIAGRAWFSYWPRERFGFLLRPSAHPTGSGSRRP